jgi:hypothetical protein
VLFKLHGSADWLKIQGRIVKSQPIYDPTDPAYQNVMIYPATRKVAIEDRGAFFHRLRLLGAMLGQSGVVLSDRLLL